MLLLLSLACAPADSDSGTAPTTLTWYSTTLDCVDNAATWTAPVEPLAAVSILVDETVTDNRGSKVHQVTMNPVTYIPLDTDVGIPCHGDDAIITITYAVDGIVSTP
jgi:hypothetical protein